MSTPSAQLLSSLPDQSLLPAMKLLAQFHINAQLSGTNVDLEEQIRQNGWHNSGVTVPHVWAAYLHPTTAITAAIPSNSQMPVQPVELATTARQSGQKWVFDGVEIPLRSLQQVSKRKGRFGADRFWTYETTSEGEADVPVDNNLGKRRKTAKGGPALVPKSSTSIPADPDAETTKLCRLVLELLAGRSATLNWEAIFRTVRDHGDPTLPLRDNRVINQEYWLVRKQIRNAARLGKLLTSENIAAKNSFHQWQAIERRIICREILRVSVESADWRSLSDILGFQAEEECRRVWESQLADRYMFETEIDRTGPPPRAVEDEDRDGFRDLVREYAEERASQNISVSKVDKAADAIKQEDYK
jgi:hypothetical protein